MSDPFRIWAAQAGMAKQKSVRIMWPELADALDGKVTGSGGAAEPETPPQPRCSICHEMWGTHVHREGWAVCGMCIGRLGQAARRGLTRRLDWRKIGPLEGWK